MCGCCLNVSESVTLFSEECEWKPDERVVSFKSPGPCVATLLNQLTPLVRGHSSAGLVQPAPVGVI